MRPGLTAQVTVHGEAWKNVLYLPRQAVAKKKASESFTLRAEAASSRAKLKIDAQDESRVAVEGIAAGTEVAMIDPTVSRKMTDSDTALPSGGGQP